MFFNEVRETSFHVNHQLSKEENTKHRQWKGEGGARGAIAPPTFKIEIL